MLRTLLLLIVLVIVIFIALVMTGFVNLRQESSGVSVQTKDIEVGTTPANVQLPTVTIENRQVEVPSVTLSDGNSAQ
ncbi:hypothetical protein RCO27_09450 [Sphingosinicella sp. LHD-64]|uniref:hypothetical protein n=1 Tax=Sphingosinicella sp. LHD-64 TaxID=3072139 RepID=UPI00280C9C53|nr:hypothetical protein [Sphingosinicella sp. LHD-64]MDQ8756454.1 hypothetical protein [Sphingosinicella sp. LHD-64]